MRERRKGVWELRVYLGRDPASKRPRQVSRTFRGSKRDAQTALAKLVTERQEGHLGGSNSSVAEMLDAWLVAVKPSVTGSTLAVYEDTVKRLKTTDLALVRLRTLDSHDIDMAYAQLRQAGATDHVMVQVHRYLGTALRRAVNWGWLQRNPQALATRPPTPTTHATELSAVDVRNLVAKAKETRPELAAMILIGALTGLRRGELCALRWSDISGSTMTVARSHAIVRGAVVVKPPKMRRAGETERIELDEICLAALEDVHDLQRARADELGVDLPDDGYVLSHDGMGGAPWRPDRFGREVREVGETIGLKASPHRLRHFTASQMIAAGVDVATTATRMRHRDQALTLRRYVHDDRGRAQEAAGVLGRALTPIDEKEQSDGPTTQKRPPPEGSGQA